MRSVDQLDGTRLGSDVNVSNPFFSPDGKWVGFAAIDDNSWKKVSLLGGSPVTLFPSAAPPLGATWAPDDTIIFANRPPAAGLMRGPAAGGEPEVLTTPSTERGESRHLWPEILPGGEAVLFTIVRGFDADDMDVAVLDLATMEQEVLLSGGTRAQYVATGHLVYGVDGALHAVPFDLERLEVSGGPAPMFEGVMTDAEARCSSVYQRRARWHTWRAIPGTRPPARWSG